MMLYPLGMDGLGVLLPFWHGGLELSKIVMDAG